MLHHHSASIILCTFRRNFNLKLHGFPSDHWRKRRSVRENDGAPPGQVSSAGISSLKTRLTGVVSTAWARISTLSAEAYLWHVIRLHSFTWVAIDVKPSRSKLDCHQMRMKACNQCMGGVNHVRCVWSRMRSKRIKNPGIGECDKGAAPVEFSWNFRMTKRCILIEFRSGAGNLFSYSLQPTQPDYPRYRGEGLGTVPWRFQFPLVPLRSSVNWLVSLALQTDLGYTGKDHRYSLRTASGGGLQ